MNFILNILIDFITDFNYLKRSNPMQKDQDNILAALDSIIHQKFFIKKHPNCPRIRKSMGQSFLLNNQSMMS